MRRAKLVAWCASCGPLTGTDEDGCCVTCGGYSIGDGATAALRALRASKRLRAEVNELRRAALDFADTLSANAERALRLRLLIPKRK